MAGSLYRRKIRGMIGMDRCRYRHDMEFTFGKLLGVCRELHLCIANGFVSHFLRRIDASAVQINLGFVGVKTDDLDFLRISDCDRHAYIPQSDQG